MSLNSANQGNLSKYRVVAELGHGGMADVYLAVVRGPVGFNKLVVVKQLRPHLAEVPDFLDMFLDEARLAARLNHPNVVQTNEVVEEAGRYFICMEYLDGQSLDRVLRRGSKEKKLTLPHKLRILCEALEGLHYAHELRDFDGTPLHVVHRDVTPHNLFVTYEGQVKLVDFGIAKAANCSAETRTGVLKGKIAYMAPEQARGDELDRRADIFSMGLLLWEMIAEARPWKGLNDIQILSRLATNQIPPPSSVRPSAPKELERICLKAASIEPSHRYATAAEMREDLERYVDQAGLRSSQREVGAVVADLFQDRRAEIRAIIDGQLREAKSLPTGEFQQAPRPISLADLTATGSSMSPLSTTKLPALRNEDDADGTSRPGQTPVHPTHSRLMTASVSEAEVPDKKSKALPLGLAAVVGALALGLALASGKKSDGAATASPAVASAEPTAARASLCEIKISASPPEAKIFLDDAPLPSNPFSSRFPLDGASHRVRAEAPGFIPKTELVSFNQATLAVDLALSSPAATAEPKTKPPVVMGKGAPARTAGDDPALPPPKTKKGDRRQLDGDDPWAK